MVAKDNVPSSISYSFANDSTPWCGEDQDILFLTSGQFTSTIKDSENVSGIDGFTTGICYNGVDTLWCGFGDDKMYLQSGQFTSTLKTSQSTPSVGEDWISDIATEDVVERLSDAPPPPLEGVIIFRRRIEGG